MISKDINIKNTDEYIACFPENIQLLLKQLRTTIRNAAPEAEEVISYQMPAYKYHGMLLYFAAYKYHIGFYLATSGIEDFRNELTAFKISKGTIQFPIDKPLPLELITRIVKFRMMGNAKKAENNRKKK